MQKPSLKISDGDLKEINYAFYKSDSMNISISTFEIFDTTIGLIREGFSHEVVLFPSSDTVIIDVTPMEESDSGMLNKKFRNPGLFLFAYIGKNKAFYELFDSLAYLTGAVHMTNTGLRAFNNNIHDYFKSITNTFHDRLNYINKIFKQNSFPINIQILVLKDIESSYINGLLVPLSDEQFNDVSKYPNEYVDSLSKRDLGNLDYFKKTFNYQYAAIDYATFFLNKFDNNNPCSNQQLINRYAVVKKHFSGEVQSNLLVTTLEIF